MTPRTRRRSRPMIAVAVAAVVMLTSACLPPEVRTVSSVDLSRYVGLWYQVAAYELPFNVGLVGVTAEYGALPDGRISVVNTGRKGTLDGPIDRIEGVARVADRTTNAKLEVTFGSVPFSDLFPGQYWIIDLDAENYSYAVVSDPLRASLFILSRTPTLPADVYQGILTRLRAQSFDLSRLIPTPQPAA